MSWNDTPIGAILGATKKSEFDRAFDNQQRLKDELSQFHGWAASGSVDGKHNGVSRWHTTGTVAAGLTETVITSLALSEMLNGAYELLFIVQNAADVKWFSGSLLITESWVKKLDAYFFTNSTTVQSHLDNSNCTNAAPANYPYLRIYAGGNTITFAMRTSGLAASTTYFFSLHQLADFSV